MNMKGQESYGVVKHNNGGYSSYKNIQGNGNHHSYNNSVGSNNNGGQRYQHIADDPYMHNNLSKKNSLNYVNNNGGGYNRNESLSPPRQQNTIGKNYKDRAAQIDKD